QSAGASRTARQADTGTADQVYPRGATSQIGRVGIGVAGRHARITGAQRAAPGHAKRRRIRAVLNLGALLIHLADVDNQGAPAGRPADPDEWADQNADGASLVAAALPDDPARERSDRVSHGITPCAVSVTGEPRLPEPPISPAIAPIGVTKLNE